MTISMFTASVPVFIRNLRNLSTLLDKAQQYTEQKKIDETTLTSARLFIDMLPLSRQVQIATDVLKAGAARLAGVDIPSYQDTETTYTELQERIAKTITFLEGFRAEQINGSEDKVVTIKAGAKEFTFNGQEYLLAWVLPNMFFHITTAYNIMRHNGVEIGKADFLSGGATPQ